MGEKKKLEMFMVGEWRKCEWIEIDSSCTWCFVVGTLIQGCSF
jgi:hypothetical protein